MAKTIVILGASYAGLPLAHSLLKNTLPNMKDLKVILVNPADHMYWSMASVRAIVPGQFSDEQVIQPIAPGFAKYSKDNFEFVLGLAEDVDTVGKRVTVKTDGSSRSLSYDYLVIATGSSAGKKSPWKAANSLAETKSNLHEAQAKIQSATSIVVGGAGTTGVETAGELGFEYGKTKEITIISSGATVLPGDGIPKVRDYAAGFLESYNVKIILNAKVLSSTTKPTGPTELKLSNGETITTDLYLPSIGLAPNSSFMAKQYLNARSEIKVDENLTVTGLQDVWAIGDVSDRERSNVLRANEQMLFLQKTLHAILADKSLATYSVPTTLMGAVTVGRSKGVGHFGDWALPSLGVWLLKGRTLGTQKLPSIVAGTGGAV